MDGLTNRLWSCSEAFAARNKICNGDAAVLLERKLSSKWGIATDKRDVNTVLALASDLDEKIEEQEDDMGVGSKEGECNENSADSSG